MTSTEEIAEALNTTPKRPQSADLIRTLIPSLEPKPVPVLLIQLEHKGMMTNEIKEIVTNHLMTPNNVWRSRQTASMSPGAGTGRHHQNPEPLGRQFSPQGSRYMPMY
jgi:hypothetical protein